MESYADGTYYVEVYGGTSLGTDILGKALNDASRHIDALTFNRIVECGGINALTEFQKEIVRAVCCELAEWEYDNAEVINATISSYSLNGVSITYGNNDTMKRVNGVSIPYTLYSKLEMTGLCCRLI